MDSYFKTELTTHKNLACSFYFFVTLLSKHEYYIPWERKKVLNEGRLYLWEVFLEIFAAMITTQSYGF